MQEDFLILLPPSEGKTPGGQGLKAKPSKEAKIMIKRLQTYGGDWGNLLGVKGNALEDAMEINRKILKSPTMPAIERYAGVVYDGIGFESMSKKGRAFFLSHARIVSAVFGLLKPDDPIPNYKLKIEKLDAAAHWKPIIEKRLANSFVIDLLPNAHKKAVGYANGIEVQFYTFKNGKRASAGHFGKLIKGKFVRWLCENRIDDPANFTGFQEDGYRWNGKAFLQD